MNPSESRPQKLGKYLIKSVIGQGAMGVVYEGYDPLIERTVALKTVNRTILDSDEAEPLLKRFKREAQAAGKLTHPNIVTVYEYGEENDIAYIAMEYIKGRSLKEMLASGERLSLQLIKKIMLQLLEALDYAHRQGVIHRDIKPANIILFNDGAIKIMDFGIARIESSNLTQFGDVMGTPSFMSPEQCTGSTVDNRTDIFSGAAVLYYMLTGEKAFPGNNMTTIMHRVINVEPIVPSSLDVNVPSGLDQCVLKGLAKKPEDRFQTAKEFSLALDGVDSTGEQKTGMTMAQSGVDDETILETAAAVEISQVPKKRFSRSVLFVAGIIIVAAALLIAWFLARSPEEKDTTPVKLETPAKTIPKKETATRKENPASTDQTPRINITSKPLYNKVKSYETSPHGLRPRPSQ